MQLQGNSHNRRKTNAYAADILRAVSHGKKRFFAILLITMLGVMMFSGLKASCVDLRKSADRFFDDQNLHDLYIRSTLGFSEDDLEAIRRVPKVLRAEGEYEETVKAISGSSKEVSAAFADGSEKMDLRVRTLLPEGTDRPYIVSGRLPKSADEMVITKKCSRDTGTVTGDSILIPDPDEDTHLLGHTFKVTGIIVDVTDVNNPFGSVSYRSSTTDANTAFLLPEAVDADFYTGVTLILAGSRDMNTYTDAYQASVKEVTDLMENEIRSEREEARTEEIRAEAKEEWQKERDKVERELVDAQNELFDGEREFSDKTAEGKEEISKGERELEKKILDAEKELEEGRDTLNRELYAGLEKLLSGEREWKKGREKLDAGEAELAQNEEKAEKEFRKARQEILQNEEKLRAAKITLAESEREIADGEKQIAEEEPKVTAGLSAVNGGLAELTPKLTAVESQISELEGQISSLQSGISAAEQAMAAYAAQMEAQSGAGTSDGEPASGGEVPEMPQVDIDALRGQLAAANEGLRQLTEAKREIEETRSGLIARKETLEAAKITIEANKKKLSGGRKKLAAGREQYESGMAELAEGKAKLDKEESDAAAKFEKGKKELEDGKKKLEESRRQLDEGWEEYERGKAEAEQKIADGEKELADGRKEGEQKLADAKKELDEGMAEGGRELNDGWADYKAGRADAEKELADAWKEILDMETATWYIEDRSSLSGYSNIGSDADSIEAIGTVFPIVFFIVAILMSLTTITRMVEEDRGLIGTYKSLGFTDREIRRKYLLYALAACAAGGALGTILAFVALPSYIFTIFAIMYLLPGYYLSFVPSYGFTGPLLFLAGILLAAAYACRKELAETPASLMRPKAPAAGSRVLLERISPVWRRMSFLGKVTARNLFRYKKRMFMTVFGIAGCMALLLFGFAIGDSVHDLMPRQYIETQKYDLMAVAGNGEDGKIMMEAAADRDEIEMYQPFHFSTAKILFGGEEENVQLFVFPDGVTDIGAYLQFRDISGKDLILRDGEVYITRNAGNVHGFARGDTVTIQLPDLQRADMEVSALVEYFLGNVVFMSEGTYRQHFEKYAENGLLARLSDSCPDEAAFVKEFGKRGEVVTAVSTEEMRDQFRGAFRLIDVVVYIVIALSAALAFVVLFTLQTTNISERLREIATIKVLGFYDREVHLYIDKETLILTGIGMVLGVPLGYAFAQTLTAILNLPSIYLAVSLHPVSYVISAGLTFGFAILVSAIMDRTLDGVDPVEALKSVE